MPTLVAPAAPPGHDRVLARLVSPVAEGLAAGYGLVAVASDEGEGGREPAGHGAGGSELPVDYLYAACGFFAAVPGREWSRIKNVARDTVTILWQRGHGGFI